MQTHQGKILLAVICILSNRVPFKASSTSEITNGLQISSRMMRVVWSNQLLTMFNKYECHFLYHFFGLLINNVLQMFSTNRGTHVLATTPASSNDTTPLFWVSSSRHLVISNWRFLDRWPAITMTPTLFSSRSRPTSVFCSRNHAYIYYS